MAHLTLTPRAFAQKWGDNETKEKAAAQEHLIDLCRMLGKPTPNGLGGASCGPGKGRNCQR